MRVDPAPPDARLVVPPGFQIAEYARDLEGGRWLALAPNGDILVAEHSVGRITVFRDVNHDGNPDERYVFTTGLTQPFGMAFHPSGWLYVADTSAVRRFRYRPGQTEADGDAEKIVELPSRGYREHWTRNILFTPDGTRLLVTVGSETNDKPEADPRRAAINEYTIDGTQHSILASGLRNPIGMAFEPSTHVLYAVVNERDQFGEDLVPDYLTSVRDNGFYGWPYAYFGPHPDPTLHGQRPDLVARTIVPDLSMGAHTAVMDIVFYSARQFPSDYDGDAFVSMHGSWNRADRVGYKVVRVHFQNGRPTHVVQDFVTGWLTPDQRVWGRPVGMLVDQDGALLIADDGGNKIWRVSFQR